MAKPFSIALKTKRRGHKWPAVGQRSQISYVCPGRYWGWADAPPGLRAADSQRSGHLLEIVGAAGIQDGAALEQLQGLLDLALKTHD